MCVILTKVSLLNFINSVVKDSDTNNTIELSIVGNVINIHKIVTNNYRERYAK